MGFHADPLVLGAGAAVAAACLAVLLAVTARRAIRPVRDEGGPRPSRAARAVTAGLPVAAVLGTRNAVGSGSRDSAPAWVNVAGSVAAVAAVAATAVFGASLAQLVTHPRDYGWNWDVLLQAEGGYGNFEPLPRLEKIVAAQPGIAAWSTFGFSQLPTGGQLIPVAGVRRWRGDILPPTTSGRPLAGNGEIELGAVTMRQLGLHLGDKVAIGLPGHVLNLRLVGTVTLPSFGVEGAEHVSLGRGAMLTEDDLFRAAAVNLHDLQLGSPAAATLPSALAIDVAPGTSAAKRAAMVAKLIAARPDSTPGGTYTLDRPLAAEISNASGMSGQPLALALGLAVAAVLSLALTVLAAVRRQRRELALLKTLGMSRRQIRSIVAWQTTVTLAIAVAAGIPLGVAAGRWAWQAFAGSLGVAPATAVPALALIAGAAVLLAAGNLLTALPGAIAARTAPAVVLRAD